MLCYSFRRYLYAILIGMSKYSESGVDLEAGDDFSAFAGTLCRKTWTNSPFVEVKDFSRGHFRGPRGFWLKNLPAGCWLDASPDGDGTKPVLVDAASDYVNAARGFVAMTGGDITRWGGLPLILVNNLEVRSLGTNDDSTNAVFRTMMRGLKDVADEERLVLFKGETAELGACIATENKSASAAYLWSGVAIGAYDPARVITGDALKKGMVVMALREYGFRNNGISLARKALRMRYGDDYCSLPEARSAVVLAAAPAVLYDRFLTTMNGWGQPCTAPQIPIAAIIHVTGGGIVGKFGKDILFPRGLSAELDNLWSPPEIMRYSAEWAEVSDRECYETWHGGQGVLVVVKPQYENTFKILAERCGLLARPAGKITEEKTPMLTIRSKFRDEMLVYSAQ